MALEARGTTPVRTDLGSLHDVIDQGHDRDLLVPMALADKDVLHRDTMHVPAEMGHFSGR